MKWLKTLKYMVFSTTRKLTLATDENVRIQKRIKYSYLYCSQDKEQNGTQFLQTGVTMTYVF